MRVGVEKIGYGVPQYKDRNINFGMSVTKRHVIIGFDYGVISDGIQKQLEENGYKLGLQTLQIKFNQNVPTMEIQNTFDEIKESNNHI